MTKEFEVMTILSVTTGRLLTTSTNEHSGNGIGKVYELLGWMTDDSPFTHQLPRFSDECKPWLDRWFPDLAAVEAEVVKECEAGNVIGIREELERRLGKTRMVPKMPRDDHDVKHPLEELIEMRGSKDGIVIVQTDDK